MIYERILAWYWLPTIMCLDWSIFVVQQMIVAQNYLQGDSGDGKR